jgi:hypothetical protein
MAWAANLIASIAKERAFAGIALSSHGGKSQSRKKIVDYSLRNMPVSN